MVEGRRLMAHRLGFWMAVATAVLTILALVMAVTTLPRSGPSCTYDVCVAYPYTDIAEYFPRDYLWMVPATLLLFPFVVLISCVHNCAADDRRAFGAAGIAFAAMSAAILATIYFVQLTVVQPSIERGEVDGLSLISQYNPHGLFIALESIGYLSMSLTFFLMSWLFTDRSFISRCLRWVFTAAFLLTVGSLLGLIAAYGDSLEYRFEIAAISINWIALIVGASLLSIRFRDSRNIPAVVS